MKTKLTILLAMVALVISSAFAAEVDLAKSNLKWKGTKITGEHYGFVPLKSGTVEIKDGKMVGGEFVADLKNYTIKDIDGEWATKFLNHTKGPDFFEVSKYPTAKLKIKSVKGNTATADLTIKGKTETVKFDIKKEGKSFTGVLKFDRTKFGMIYGSKSFFKSIGDKAIHNEVEVSFKIVPKA